MILQHLGEVGREGILTQFPGQGSEAPFILLRVLRALTGLGLIGPAGFLWRFKVFSFLSHSSQNPDGFFLADSPQTGDLCAATKAAVSVFC